MRQRHDNGEVKRGYLSVLGSFRRTASPAAAASYNATTLLFLPTRDLDRHSNANHKLDIATIPYMFGS